MTNLAIKEQAKKVPYVWVGCLASYNEGTLHGEWIEIPTHEEALRDQIQRVIETSNAEYAEEYFFADYENCPESFGEYENIKTLVDFAIAVDEHGLDKVNAFLQFASMADIENIDDCFQGEWSSWDDFVYEQAELLMGQAGIDDSILTSYFDYEKWSRDLSYDYNECHEGGTCFVFSNY